VRLNELLVDVALAVVIALLVVILTPGLAVAAIVAIFLLVVCAVSFGLEWWRARWRRGRASGSRGRPGPPGTWPRRP